ncbi:hypothetical protein BZL30_5875 [Mycobacterium kansasii]|uniref:Uncharacterized protein n=1 Tax=Mycobacterium kansasii TaxID=1768 RepID=A0A1V3WYJ9_MYCKA|nr:hypothetical protein BZL30_5875 [Mycobacterium kansasii]
MTTATPPPEAASAATLSVGQRLSQVRRFAATPQAKPAWLGFLGRC